MRANTLKDTQINKTAKKHQDVKQYFPGFIAFVDCTGQQIPRPESKRRRKVYYSGKRKRHTVKTQIVVNNSGTLIHKTENKKGHRQDYDIYEKNNLVTPKQVVNVFDLGYLGVGKDFPDHKSSIPSRNNRNKKNYLKMKKSTTTITREKGW